MALLLYFAVSFGASIIGAICGIGGGVIIKPVLDLFGWAGVSTISFLSSCTVLSMSCYSVGRSLLARDSKVSLRTGTPLAIGAAIGGIAGKQLFAVIKSMSSNANAVGSVQAACLAVITLGTLLYTVRKAKIRTHQVSGTLPCLIIGVALGVCSSFLGIGGGPINLVVLYFFFSMETKTAAANSLYIILFSQISSLLFTLVTRSVPPFEVVTLALMVCGGIAGGIVGRTLNKRLDSRAVERLFILLMCAIIFISLYNAWKYAVL